MILKGLISSIYLPELFLCGDDTPLQSSPLLAEFGYTGNTCAGDEVTAGTYIPPPDTDEYAKLLLKCVKRPSHVPETTIKTPSVHLIMCNGESVGERKHQAAEVAVILVTIKFNLNCEKNTRIYLRPWLIFLTVLAIQSNNGGM